MTTNDNDWRYVEALVRTDASIVAEYRGNQLFGALLELAAGDERESPLVLAIELAARLLCSQRLMGSEARA